MTNLRPAAISAFAVAAMSVFTALAQLNSTVNVLTKPQAPIPGECEQGLAPAQPRMLVAQTPLPAPPAPAPTGPPPTLDLKTRLRSVETAAEQGDRDRFKAAMASARSAIAGYPLGGERDAANDILGVYEDLERLWDYAFTSPSGAFFDATTNNGALLKMLERYPGYDRAVADATLTVGGTTVYPTAESRAFLASEASRRLAQLGVKMPERIAQVQPPTPLPPHAPVTTTKRKPSEKIVKARPKKRETHVAEAKPHRMIVHKPRVKVAENRAPHSVPHPKKSTASHVAAPAAVPPTTTEAPPPAPAASPAPAQVSAPTPPAAAAPAQVPAPPTNTAAMPPAMQTAPPQTATAPATTTAPNPGAAQQKSGGRVNLLFAIILIIVGIGVLIVLLRASD